MKKCIAILLLFTVLQSRAQQLYFPPIVGNTWDTMSPAALGWCQPGIDSLYAYLEQTHTSAFMILKGGKIVLEKYFGTFTADSAHYWASAGKSLVGFMVGMAQEKGLLNIGSPVSNYLGSGWTAAPTAKESQISVRNLLTMTSGLEDKPAQPCDNESTSAACLQYLTDTGQRWAYHTGAYQQLAAVLSKTSGQNINNFTSTNVGNRIGMTGLWVNGVYFSKTRSMARFGLLALNKGVWQTDTLLHDQDYFTAMTNTSQPYNPAYGYLWWLNGKSSFLSPGLQFVFQGSLFPNAPADMFCALGKNDQKIYVVPSQNLVVIRTGESSYGAPVAFSPFDDLLWGKIDSLGYKCNYTFIGNGNWSDAANWEGKRIPPKQLDKAGIITINPVIGGQCVLDIAQIIATTASLVISANAKFIVAGKLDVLRQ